MKPVIAGLGLLHQNPKSGLPVHNPSLQWTTDISIWRKR